MEEEWLSYRSCQFNGRRMVMLRRWSVLVEGEWSCYRSGHFNGGRMIMVQRWSLMDGDGHVTGGH